MSHPRVFSLAPRHPAGGMGDPSVLHVRRRASAGVPRYARPRNAQSGPTAWPFFVAVLPPAFGVHTASRSLPVSRRNRRLLFTRRSPAWRRTGGGGWRPTSAPARRPILFEAQRPLPLLLQTRPAFVDGGRRQDAEQQQRALGVDG